MISLFRKICNKKTVNSGIYCSELPFSCILAVLILSALIPAGAARAEESAGDQITLVMAGDVLMHEPVLDAGRQADGSLDYDILFDGLKDEIETADIAIVNQETILGGEKLRYTGYPSFNSPYEVGDAEVRAGFDVILQGSNHALDRSAGGIFNCLGFWKDEHPDIKVLGIHDDPEDRNRICVVEKNGISVSILNYTYGTNGIQMPEGMGYLVDYLSENRVRSDIKRARELSDLVVVCPHWGTEYKLGISEYQEKWTGIFLSEGVDLVIGTHPHVIEPVMWKADENGHRILVYYSLGNFVNSTNGTGKGVMNRMVGGLAYVAIKKDPDGKTYVAGYDVIPVVCHLEEGSVKAYHIKDYNEELAEQNLIRSRDPDFSYESVKELLRDVWPFYEIKSGR